LWEGTSDAGAAPRDFVVKAPLNVTADAVIVYLDTTRVRGWNEIDAIEVVGRDGQRHWAASASASSTYAEHRTETNPPQ
jgi:hypothetical protein